MKSAPYFMASLPLDFPRNQIGVLFVREPLLPYATRASAQLRPSDDDLGRWVETDNVITQSADKTCGPATCVNISQVKANNLLNVSNHFLEEIILGRLWCVPVAQEAERN